MSRILKFSGKVLISLGALSGTALAQAPPPPPAPGSAVPFPHLTQAELARWNAGKAAFTAPATQPGGLGPVFNQNNCAACHGGPQTLGGSSPILGTRFGRIVNGQYDPLVAYGGPTIQAQGIGKVNGVNFVGEVVPPQANVVAHRRTPALFGLGLVDAILESDLHNLAAHQSATTPATAGVPNVMTDPLTGHSATGRFGWKAQQPTLHDFAGDALLNEVGVTTSLYPFENCPQGNCNLLVANPARSNPNAPDSLIQALVDFMAFNAPPTPPSTTPPSPAVQAGAAIFGAIGCANCHTPTWKTGPSASASLNEVTFSPYSDFLLHDMGSLGDGIPQGSSTPTQMRTAPLWGIRFEKTFLHDGRASTVAQAIQGHAGQGAASARAFNSLTATQQAQLLAFLNSL